MAAHMMVPCISHRTWLTYVINYFQIFVGHTQTLSELLTVNLQPAPKVMLTNHNSDNLDLVSNCNTVSTTTQHSFGNFFNSIQSFGNFIKSSGCMNFTKNNIFESFMYCKLCFSNSIPNFIILNVPNPNCISTILTALSASVATSTAS